jgi:hypothetical protein
VTKPQIEFIQADFDFETIEDELLVDGHCQTLLHLFYQQMQQDGLEPQKASDLAYCADYYVRDYLIDFKRQNLLLPEPGTVRQFAANWYITRTLEPEIAVLKHHLEAIARFYDFLYKMELINKKQLDAVLADTTDIDYYEARICEFLAISGDGFVSWELACPMTKRG